MASNFNTSLFKIVGPHLGTYLNNGRRLPAFSTDSPIAMEVEGLEVTIGLPNFTVEQIGNVALESTCLSIYLTQWPTGRQTIFDCLRAILSSGLAYGISAESLEYDSLKRYLVTMDRLCIC
jgi:hypothetical protein